MGIAILVIIGAVAAFGAFGFLTLTRGRQHARGVGRYDAGQFGARWGGDAGGWSSGHHGGHGGYGGFDGGGGGSSCGDGGGGGGSC